MENLIGIVMANPLISAVAVLLLIVVFRGKKTVIQDVKPAMAGEPVIVQEANLFIKVLIFVGVLTFISILGHILADPTAVLTLN